SSRLPRSSSARSVRATSPRRTRGSPVGPASGSSRGSARCSTCGTSASSSEPTAMDAKRVVRDALIGAAAPVAERSFRERPSVRVVAFHDTPHAKEGELRERLRRLANRSAVVPLADAFERKQLDPERLNVVLTFDDGLKEHHAVAARVLDDLGLAGTFFVP